MSNHLFKPGDRIVWPRDARRSSSLVKHGTVEAASNSGLALSVRWDDGKFGVVRAVDTAHHVTSAG